MKKLKGFTLIELLVAILIVALVAVVGFLIIPGLLDNVNNNKNTISMKSIKSSAGLYVSEYSDEILWITEYTGTNTNVTETGNDYACTTVKMLQNKGYIKDEVNFSDPDTNINVNENTSLKILRDKEKLVVKDEIILNSIDCTEYDTTKLDALFSATGDKNSDDNEWYIANLNVNVKPIGKDNAEIGKSGIYGIQYVIKDNEKDIGEIITVQNSSGKLSEDGLNIPVDTNSDNLKVCVSIINGLHVYTEEICSPIYKLDSSTPSFNIKASDDIESNEWHKANFDLSIEENSFVSPLTYYIDGNDNPSVERNKISISDETNSSSYYFKVCNEAGTCSSVQNYVVKLDKTKPSVNLEKSTEAYVKKLTLTGTASDSGSGIVKYKISEESNYNDSGWTSVDVTNEITTTKEITENGKYYLWVEDEAGNYNSIVNNVTNIDNEGPVYVSGGSVSEGSVTEAKFTDVSTPITVYYIIKTSQGEPTENEFTSTTRTFSTTCATSYYAYAKAVDSLGNYTIKYLGKTTTASCCSEGTWGELYCNSKGWYEQDRYNECLGETEYKTTTDACESDSDCDSWGDCQRNDERYRNCTYYYGGVEKETTESDECEYENSDTEEDSSDWNEASRDCSTDDTCENGEGQCEKITTSTAVCPNGEYVCYCCDNGGSWNGAGSCVY